MIFPHFPAGILLASGLSRRMGTCKQLLPLHGKPLIHYSIEALVNAGIPYIYITVSADIAAEVHSIVTSIVPQHAVADTTIDTSEHTAVSGECSAAAPVITLIHNPHPEYGQGFSTALATAAACKRQHVGFLFCPADQPFLKSTSIQALCRYFLLQPAAIVSAAYEGKRGSPVIFPADVSADLCALCGDIGGRVVIQKHSDRLCLFSLDNALELFDIDTTEDFQYVQNILNGRLK